MSGDDHLPTLVCIIGAPAVGKMTVGQALCARTGYKLFHGHVVADLLSPYFPFGTPEFVRFGHTLRCMFIEEAQSAGLNLVTTVAWRFDLPGDTDAIRSWLRPYLDNGRVICPELVAPLDVRRERNRTENRHRHKNPYWVTDDYLREMNAAHRYDSGGTLPFDVPHLRIETEHLSAEVTAGRIIDHFGLPRLDNLDDTR